MRRVALGLALTGALLLVPVAVAATPGDYDGWLYKANGERWKGTFTTMRVHDTKFGQRFRLSSYNMRLTCPYPDRNGNWVKARFRFIHRGKVAGRYINDTRSYPEKSPSHRVQIIGRFSGRWFLGRVVVRAAPGIVGACTGSARIRVSRL